MTSERLELETLIGKSKKVKQRNENAETNLKRLERLKNIRMPDLTHQSADFQDWFIGGAREQIVLFKNGSFFLRKVEV